MKVLKVVLGTIGGLLAGYGLITGTSSVMAPYFLMVMALMAAVMGIIEFQKRKATSFGLFLAAGFALFVGVYIL